MAGIAPEEDPLPAESPDGEPEQKEDTLDLKDTPSSLVASQPRSDDAGEQPLKEEECDTGIERLTLSDTVDRPEADLDAGEHTGNKTITQQLQCPEGLVGKLIGRKGETIQFLEKDTGCRIQVDQSSLGPNKQVTITGATKELMDSAISKIQSVLASDGPTNECSVSLDCPPSVVGRIIGRGGETIKSLQMASAALIKVDQNFPDGEPRRIHLTGTAESINRARQMIEELILGEPGSASYVITKYGAGITETVECPKSMVGKVIGKGGETIKGLQRATQCNVQINQEPTPCLITITGPSGSVQECKRQVVDIVNGTSSGFGGHRHSMPITGAYGGGAGAGGYLQQAAAYGYGGGYGAPAGYGSPQGQGYPGFAAYGGAPAQQFAAYGGGASAQQFGVYGGAAGGFDPVAHASPVGSGTPGMSGYGQGVGGMGGYGAGSVGAQASLSDWQECFTEEGSPYYYNAKTGQSVWEKPGGM